MFSPVFAHSYGPTGERTYGYSGEREFMGVSDPRSYERGYR